MVNCFIDPFQELYDRLTEEGYELQYNEVDAGIYQSVYFVDGEFRLCFTNDYGEHVYPILANRIACDPCFDKWKSWKVPFYVELPITVKELDWVIEQIKYWHKDKDAYEISKKYIQEKWISDYPKEIKFTLL